MSGETYPADNAMVVGSIGLHGRATGTDHRAVIDRFSARLRHYHVDPDSGLLYQAVDAATGEPTDRARASGTALSIYALAPADADLSRELFEALCDTCRADILGHGALLEYPRSSPRGAGDVDSGPLVFGRSPSASGFAPAGARIHGDEDLYRALYRSASVTGLPIRRKGKKTYAVGGTLSDAILLAVLTAGPGTVVWEED